MLSRDLGGDVGRPTFRRISTRSSKTVMRRISRATACLRFWKAAETPPEAGGREAAGEVRRISDRVDADMDLKRRARCGGSRTVLMLIWI